MTTTNPNQEPMRRALLANAIFSLATGAALTFWPQSVGGWLGVDVDGWLRLLGIALLGHTALLVVASRLPDLRRPAILNLVAIAPYPMLMVLLVLTGLVDRNLGRVLVLADGAVVAAIAIAHGKALRQPVPQREHQPA